MIEDLIHFAGIEKEKVQFIILYQTPLGLQRLNAIYIFTWKMNQLWQQDLYTM